MMTEDDKLYWLKFVLALIAALICSTTPALLGKFGIITALLMYLASYPVAVFILKINPAKAGGLRRMLLSGLITYLFVFTVIAALILTFTIGWP